MWYWKYSHNTAEKQGQGCKAFITLKMLTWKGAEKLSGFSWDWDAEWKRWGYGGDPIWRRFF